MFNNIFVSDAGRQQFKSC